MEICREIDYRFILPYLLNSLGIVTEHLKEYDKSRQYYQESLVLFQELGDQFGVGMAHDNLGHICGLMGDDATAAVNLKAAIRAGLEMESFAMVLDAIAGMAKLAAKTGQRIYALELATLVEDNSATRIETKQKIESLIIELKDRLSVEQVATAKQKGKSLLLAEVAADLFSKDHENLSS